jgi:hypothetical protein
MRAMAADGRAETGTGGRPLGVASGELQQRTEHVECVEDGRALRVDGVRHIA